MPLTVEAVDDVGRITARGRRMVAVGAHPRLARALLDGASRVGAERAREIVAMLSDDSGRGAGDDLPTRWRALRRGDDRAATARWCEETKRLARGVPAGGQGDEREARKVPDDLAAGLVVGLAYPDRVARARGADSATYQMSGGTGAALDPRSPLRTSPWLAIAVADRAPGRADARIRSAAPIDEATAREVAGDLLTTTDQIRWDDGRIVTRRVEALCAIVLTDVPLARPDPLLVQAAVRDGGGGGPAEDLLQLHREDRRLGTVVPEPDLRARRDLDPFRRELAEPGRRGPGQQPPERRRHVDPGKIACAAHRGQLGAEPLVETRQQRLVVDRGPRVAEVGVAEREPLP